MSLFKKLWWCCFPPSDVTVFYLSGSFRMRTIVGTKMAMELAKLNFLRCSKEEQDFIVWRDPIFKVLLEDNKLP